MRFRELRAEEIECRIGTIKNGGLSLLLYKDARCDARILDETVCPENWQCEFYDCKGTLFCKVGILCERPEVNGVKGLAEWVWKDDAGAPSNMEAAKGEASDAFKRACFKWGIGRELYTAPLIWVYADKVSEIRQGKNGKPQCYDDFSVAAIKYAEGRIVGLAIRNETTGKMCFTYVEKGYGKDDANGAS